MEPKIQIRNKYKQEKNKKQKIEMSKIREQIRKQNKIYKIQESKGKGLGLFAIQDIQIDTIIESIHDSQLITCDLLLDFYQFQHLLYDASVCQTVLFAYFLAAMHVIGSKCQQDYWYVQEYINSLPKDIDGLLMWQARQLQQVGGQTAQRIKQKKRKISNNYDKISTNVKKVWQKHEQQGQYRLFSSIDQIQKVSLQLVIRYFYVIQSRGVFFVSNLCGGNVGALVPIIDKLNHSSNSNCVVQTGSKYTIRSERRIKAGQELLVCYGHFSNDILLQYYGFIDNTPSKQINPQLHQQPEPPQLKS